MKTYCNKCFNKTLYKTYEEAMEACTRVKTYDIITQKKGELKPYRCRFTDGWHIGHSK